MFAFLHGSMPGDSVAAKAFEIIASVHQHHSIQEHLVQAILSVKLLFCTFVRF